jgi:hypothetical protein
MKKLLIASTCACAALALGLYAGFRWVVPRWENAVVAGKMPRTAVAAVVGKEQINVRDGQASTLPDGSYVVGPRTVFLVRYRIDAFQDITDAEQEAVLSSEKKRYAKDGPRVEEVNELEYDSLEIGTQITVKYAYYPSVLWGVSDSIRVPW